MIGHPLILAGATLLARPSGALYWQEEGLLCVSDLHFGTSARAARFGGPMLPPYEVADTLTRLDADLDAVQPARVVCLGDSFDHRQAADDLAEDHRIWLLRMMAGRDWTWIAGNHDPAPMGLGGADLAVLHVGPLTFRHIAEAGASGEVSGHYHPKARLAGRARPCFLADDHRLILPAYGTFTGGLWCDHADFDDLLSPRAVAILTGTRTLVLPRRLPR